MPAHELFDPPAADLVAFCLQGGMDTQDAIAALMLAMESLNSLEGALTGCGPGALWPGSPSAIAA
jgi:hypothetical protein